MICVVICIGLLICCMILSWWLFIWWCYEGVMVCGVCVFVVGFGWL